MLYTAFITNHMSLIVFVQKLLKEYRHKKYKSGEKWNESARQIHLLGSIVIFLSNDNIFCYVLSS